MMSETSTTHCGEGSVVIAPRFASKAVLALLAVAMLAATAPPAARDDVAARVSVIVQSFFGTDHAATAVHEADGTVTRKLPIVGGVGATVPASSVNDIQRAPGILQVTPDSSIEFESVSRVEGAENDFSLEPQRIPRLLGSDRLWQQGITGRGVTVALIDTGVHAAHPDLAGRVTHCVDFSNEAGTEAECADTFGHGTFMAGLIAGNGASSGGAFQGTAPEANLVSVKVAGFDGATDISHVLGAIQWVVANRAKYGISVLNLSLGSDSSQTYLLSPLNYAVQRAWKSGITVVVSSGNSGPDARTVLKPADDPYVVTVGSSNDEGTWTIEDDRVPVFSSKGPTRSNGVPKPDVVAPGVHTISLRSPGSAVDQAYGSTAVVADSYFRGTGTSMSAASVTGVVAQIRQANPKLVPDQIKHRLTATARRIAVTDRYSAGAGMVDSFAAARSTSTARANQGLLMGLGNGLGTLQGDRGTLAPIVHTPMGDITLNGERKAQYARTAQRVNRTANANLLSLLVPWTSLTYTTLGWDPTTLGLTSWVNNDWAAMRWKDGSFEATAWEAMRWKGNSWTNLDWDAMRWKDADWDAMRWKSNSWMTTWYAAAWD